MSVRSATSFDVDAVVGIHRRALARDVAPALGDRFLARFYRRVLASPDQMLLVTSSGAAVQGFCALAMQPPPLLPVLRPRDLLTFTHHAARSPRLLQSAVVQARRPAVANWDISAEIAFIGVDQRHTGKGLGMDLVRAATAAASAGGKQLVTTKTANSRLAEFYQREFEAQVTTHFAVADSTYVVLVWRAFEEGSLIDRDR